MTRPRPLRAAVWLAAATLALTGPAAADTLTYVPAPCADPAAATEAELLRCFAPVLISEGTESAHNRIGAPALDRDLFGFLRASVDTERPVLYTELLRDTLGGRELVHLVYRLHFPRIPLRLSRHAFEAHQNPGLLVLVTLDAERREPLFVTTVHTCGCYRALIPTTRVPDDRLPPNWPASLEVHGFSLPARIEPPVAGTRPVVVTLTADRHRVSDVRVGDEPARVQGERVELGLEPMAELRSLPIAGESGRASLFYEAWPMRGHVRGAWNAFEGLTLGWVTLDPRVGTDKDFGDPAGTGTPFYTMLRFWKRDVSRLDRFEPLLGELGYRVGPGQEQQAPRRAQRAEGERSRTAAQ
jgi:hypothetical protein